METVGTSPAVARLKEWRTNRAARLVGARRERCYDMPRKRKRERPGLLPEDRLLMGTWWRCLRHGLTQDPILLGGRTYCPMDDCEQSAILVHSTLQDRPEGKRGWNDIAV
jgi:hypothetical protein